MKNWLSVTVKLKAFISWLYITVILIYITVNTGQKRFFIVLVSSYLMMRSFFVRELHFYCQEIFLNRNAPWEVNWNATQRIVRQSNVEGLRSLRSGITDMSA